MADRDVEIDVVARDKTSKGIAAAEKGFARLGKSAEQGIGQWVNGFSRLGRAASQWADSGDTAGKKFVRGIGNGLGKVAELGASVGGGLSKGITSAGPQVALAVTAVLFAAAVAAAPVMAGAIVGGAGLGGMVGGVLLASKDARVRSAFDDLKEHAGGQLQDAALRFVPATLEAVKEAKSAFNSLLPDLKRIFDVSATWLAPLTRALGQAAQFALAGITDAVTKAGPIITVIGDGIKGIGQAVGKVFSDLSDNGNSMALALSAVFGLVKLTILGIGGALNLLVEGFEWFVSKIPGGKRLLDSMTDSQDGAKSSALNLGGGFKALAGDANTAAAGLTNAKQKADEFADSNLSLREAQIAASDAVKTATKTLNENGAAKGFNTAKGKENESALNALARAFNTETEAGDRSGISAGKAAAAYSTNRANLVAMAEKAGYSRTKAEELAAQLLKVPKNVTTDVNVDTKSAASSVEWIQKKIKNIKGKTVTIDVLVQTNGDHYIPGVGTLVRDRWGGINYAMARGGMIGAHFASSPTVLFGERETGGEAFIPRRGDRERSRSIAETVVRDWLGGDVAWGDRRAGGSGGNTVNVNVTAYSDRFSLRQVMQDLALQGVH